MSDRLIEDIVAVTETLMVADNVDIEALANPDAKLTVNDKLDRHNKGLTNHAGHAGHDKAKHLKHKMKAQQDGDGVYKRTAC